MPWPRQWASARPPVTLRAGPFVGVRDNPVGAYDPQYAFAAENVVPGEIAQGGSFRSRPPFTSQTILTGAGAGQGMASVVTSTGTNYVFSVANGKLFRDTTDVTPGGTPISTSAPRVYLVQYGDALVVSDGVNRPWLATALGSTPVTKADIQVDSASTAWAAFGPPVVYGAKLVMIRASDRTRIVWSEEDAAGTGYEQTGYSNYWDLTQTSQAPLTALAATNTALYYFRESSVGAILGASEENFRTGSTDDAVSEGEGTLSPPAVVPVGDDVFFLNQHGYPRVIRGGAVVPFGDGAADTIRRANDQYRPWHLLADAANNPGAHGVASVPLGIVLFFHHLGAATHTPLVFDVRSLEYLGTWTVDGADVTAACMGRASSEARERLYFLTTGCASFSEVDSSESGNSVTISVTTGPLGPAGQGALASMRYRRARWRVGSPGLSSFAPTAMSWAASTGATGGTAPSALTPRTTGDVVFEAGWAAYGRWLRATFAATATSSTGPLHVLGCEVEAVPADQGRGVR